MDVGIETCFVTILSNLQGDRKPEKQTKEKTQFFGKISWLRIQISNSQAHSKTIPKSQIAN